MAVGAVARLVSLPGGGERVETWSAAGWVPGGTSVAELMDAPPASDADLAAAGVPYIETGA